MTPARRSVLFLVCANSIGGLTYPWQKVASAGLPPATFTALRSLLGLGLMAALLAARRRPLWPFERREGGRLALLGTVGVAVPLLVGAWGVEGSTAANASILILLEPVSIALFARVLLGERMGKRHAAGLALGLAGGLAVVTEGFTAGQTLLRGEHLLGNALLATSGLLWGLYTPLMKPLSEKRDPVALTLAAFAFASLVFVPAALLEWRQWRAGPDLGRALLATAALGVCASFLGTILWTSALKSISANAVAPLILIQPVVGAAAGAAYLGERVTAQAAAGGALVAVGVLVSLSGEERAG